MVRRLAAEAQLSVRLVSSDERLPAVKRNQALRQARGDLVLFMNDDVWVRPDLRPPARRDARPPRCADRRTGPRRAVGEDAAEPVHRLVPALLLLGDRRSGRPGGALPLPLVDEPQPAPARCCSTGTSSSTRTGRTSVTRTSSWATAGPGPATRSSTTLGPGASTTTRTTCPAPADCRRASAAGCGISRCSSPNRTCWNGTAYCPATPRPGRSRMAGAQGAVQPVHGAAAADAGWPACDQRNALAEWLYWKMLLHHTEHGYHTSPPRRPEPTPTWPPGGPTPAGTPG